MTQEARSKTEEARSMTEEAIDRKGTLRDQCITRHQTVISYMEDFRYNRAIIEIEDIIQMIKERYYQDGYGGISIWDI